jgi:MFS family permease
MSGSGFPKLAIAGTAAHLADQLLLAALPLALAASGASAGVISAVVAAQAAAWLVVSLPIGALADRLSRRTILLAGAVLVIAGAILGSVTMRVLGPAPIPLGIAAFICSAGVVMQVLSVFAMLPRIIDSAMLGKANAVLEFGRASVAIAAPLVVGLLIASGRAELPFALSIAAGLLSLVAVIGLAADAQVSADQSRISLLQSVRDGAAFVSDEPILRAIALCAIFWNSAFFAVTAVFAPYAIKTIGLSVEQVAQAWVAYGAGLLLGAAIAPAALKALPTNFLFVFGPVCSFLGAAFAASLAPRYGLWPILVGFFTLGFGPMIWLVLQTSIRQLLTPTHLLGRVAATITTAIYGVRPIAALAAGWVATEYGTVAAIWMAVAFFALSLAAILRAPILAMTTMPARVA